jgi:GNAT superfamily N-acetyltransferase
MIEKMRQVIQATSKIIDYNKKPIMSDDEMHDQLGGLQYIVDRQMYVDKELQVLQNPEAHSSDRISQSLVCLSVDIADVSYIFDDLRQTMMRATDRYMTDQERIFMPLAPEYIPEIVAAFQLIGWHKPSSLFEQYLCEQEKGERVVFVAFVNNQFAGYVTLLWKSRYVHFMTENIPEIVDLNVLPQFRQQGIGSGLLTVTEKVAAQEHVRVGIGVGLMSDYGNAQRLYVRRGYIPDGNGITFKEKAVVHGQKVTVDDDLVLWFIKGVK